MIYLGVAPRIPKEISRDCFPEIPPKKSARISPRVPVDTSLESPAWILPEVAA